ncbi:cupin domain-containing protein [Halarchaeum nitratireducens]|nr:MULTISPECIES: cupin domain-containing protein [Halarchaeum]MBP2252668.1 quercetin dioxygenase-like cupin family protein [Halarchaeum solikamskense]
MVATSFDAERAYDDEAFNAETVFESERQKVVLGFFDPGQFIPVHAPASDVAITVQSGRGIVRDAGETRRVEPGDVVVVEAGAARGVRADEETRLEATLVTAPPPSDAEHEPVREGLRRDVFDPREA